MRVAQSKLNYQPLNNSLKRGLKGYFDEHDSLYFTFPLENNSV